MRSCPVSLVGIFGGWLDGVGRWVENSSAALDYPIFVFKFETRRYKRQPSDFIIHYFFESIEVYMLQRTHLIFELHFELWMLVDCVPDIHHHFLFLLGLDSFIKVIRVNSRHQYKISLLKMIFSKVSIMPHSHLPIFIETYHRVVNQKGPKMRIQLMESEKWLTQYINTLLMSETASIN